MVGEMAIIADQPRMASLMADGEVRLLTIGRTQFIAILRERPDIALAVMRALVRILAQRESTPRSTASWLAVIQRGGEPCLALFGAG